MTKRVTQESSQACNALFQAVAHGNYSGIYHGTSEGHFIEQWELGFITSH
jgi:hypothetical protein